MAGLPAGPFPGPQGHTDAVTALPPGAVLLATGTLYRHQAFRVEQPPGASSTTPRSAPRTSPTGSARTSRRSSPPASTPTPRPESVVDAGAELDALAAAHARAFLAVVTGASATMASKAS